MSGTSPISLNASLRQVRDLAGRGNLFPLVGEMSADVLTPVAAFLRLAADRPRGFLLETVEGGQRLGRYSFLGCDPTRVVREPRLSGLSRREGGPLSSLRSVMRTSRPIPLEDLPPFTGGWVGALSYDAVRAIERLPDDAHDDLGTPDLEAGLYDAIVAFDHLRQRVQIIVNLSLEDEGGVAGAYEKAHDRIARMAARLAGDQIVPRSGPGEALGRFPVRSSAREAAGRLATESRDAHQETMGEPHSSATNEGFPHAAEASPVSGANISEEDYRRIVSEAKEEIARGEIFQVVLSRRIARAFHGSPFSVYRALRSINPSPYTYYLRHGDRAAAGASPEMLVRVRGRRLELRPIAGTRPRGADAAADRELARALTGDAKENAEHLMLVDLGRNDAGRVSRAGSVEVVRFRELERYSHVMHLVSAVESELAEGFDAFDALLASFPAGTVTGAPKVRAMEIIDRLEPTRRGAYAGAVFYCGFDGSLDSAIAIRQISLHGGMAYVQAGAGIVADSDPEAELRETQAKARAALAALDRAEAFS